MVNLNGIAKIPTKVIGKMGPVGLKLSKYSPEILLGGGILGIVGGTVLACRATLKLHDKNEEFKAGFKELVEEFVADAESSEEIEEVTESREYKQAVTKFHIQHGLDIAKLYAPAGIATATGIACIIGSHNIQSGRIAGLAAAYSAVDTAFSEYRNRVREEIGDEKELDIYRGYETADVDVTKTLKSGKEKVVKETVKTLDPAKRSMFTFIFDESNPEFTRNASYNKSFIVSQEAYANSKFDVQGYLYLNDVLESLGFDTKDMPWTRVVGWLKGLGDDYIDFGIFEAYDSSKRDFINCSEPAIWLDFNVDGYIFDKLGVKAEPVTGTDEEYLVVTEGLE